MTKPKKPSKSASRGPGRSDVSETKRAAPRQTMPAGQRELFRRLLLSMRERLNGQVTSLKNDSLETTDWLNMEEDGTDIFDQQFALNIVSSENEMLQEIDGALERMEKGAYGLCESCSNLIHEARLKALPFAKTCIECQSKLEKGTARIRPPILLENR
ncbi:MAG: TraR/DksA family transcriptional regulator [Verrucomicrobiota bacterium]|nr:TraR/DksA family transcriptional regulator [Verrucomicrobiota bacterium]